MVKMPVDFSGRRLAVAPVADETLIPMQNSHLKSTAVHEASHAISRRNSLRSAVSMSSRPRVGSESVTTMSPKTIFFIWQSPLVARLANGCGTIGVAMSSELGPERI